MLDLPDVNVLVALTNPSHVFHHEAHRWLALTAEFATTPITESGLVRLLLNPAVTGQPVSVEQAQAILAGLRAQPLARFVSDDSSLAEPSVDLTALGGHRQVTDWHLLNLAARLEARLVTFDGKLRQAVAVADRRHLLTLG